MDWHEIDAAQLYERIRSEAAPADAEQMIWALEHVLAAARVDPALLDHFAAASVCGLAYRDETTPRQILATLSRRSVDDGRWDERYAGLLTPSQPC